MVVPCLKINRNFRIDDYDELIDEFSMVVAANKTHGNKLIRCADCKGELGKFHRGKASVLGFVKVERRFDRDFDTAGFLLSADFYWHIDMIVCFVIQTLLQVLLRENGVSYNDVFSANEFMYNVNGSLSEPTIEAISLDTKQQELDGICIQIRNLSKLTLEAEVSNKGALALYGRFWFIRAKKAPPVLLE
ncbi:hypothetical protein MKW98_020870 [Papaver atlanticum]|uniref:Uncharacterized protein n=1 Tax=Papaver atlanticum TaxID=357466 RepID=A0AAD4TG80_9MAGN|nr:hypothetical protein MKW98_020870 [Papaver atlanticum]